MSSITEIFADTANALFARNASLLLAVSGGRDSVVLEDLCYRQGYRYAIAHCNFHLRPDQCDADEQFVRRIADKHGVACYVAQFDTTTYAEQHHLSVEEAARDLRYDFFDSLRQQHGFDYIVTAHHLDDSIETFFLNLMRGTSIRGLCGIPIINTRHVVRPLLNLSRADIDAYVEEHHLQYVEDATNASLQYRRNWVRHQLLPLIRDMAPSFNSTMSRTLSYLGDVEVVYRQQVERQCHDLMGEPDGNGVFHIRIDKVMQLHPQRTLLYELLHPYGFTLQQVQDIISSLSSQSGSRFVTPTHILIRDRHELLLSPIKEDAMPHIEVEKMQLPADLHSLRSLTNATTAFFDSDSVIQPLSLRHWQDGDRFHPFGMAGTQLVSDFFSDHKFSVLDKQRQLLLVDATGAILWIVGHRTSHLHRVTEKSRSMCRVKISW